MPILKSAYIGTGALCAEIHQRTGLKYDRSTITTWIAMNKIKAVRGLAGRPRWRISREEVDRVIQLLSVGAA